MAKFKDPGFWVLIFASLSITHAANISITGPGSGLAGDFEKFICEVEGAGVNEKTEIQWKYVVKDGSQAPLASSDMLSPLEIKSVSEGSLIVTNFIMLPRDTKAILCEYSQFGSDMVNVVVKDLPAVTSDSEPCEKSKVSGKPVVALYTFSTDFVLPYRKGHYLTDEEIELYYSTEVSQARLVCVSSKGSPTWTLKPGTADNMKFAAWGQEPFGSTDCKRQVIDILQVNGKPKSATKLSFECESGSSGPVSVDVTFQFPSWRSGGGPDFNQTENCVNTIVEQFYGKELTGVGIGSSFVIVLMMAGMAIMKKQMNQQQRANKELRSVGVEQPTTSTEPLNGGNGANNA